MTPALVHTGKFWHAHTGNCDTPPSAEWWCPYTSRQEAIEALRRCGHIEPSAVRDARWATCLDCGTLLRPGLYWGLRQVVGLHSNSACQHFQYWKNAS